MIQRVLRVRSTSRARATTCLSRLARPARELAMQRLLQLFGQILGVVELVLHMVHEPVHLMLLQSMRCFTTVSAAASRAGSGARLGHSLLGGR